MQASLRKPGCESRERGPPGGLPAPPHSPSQGLLSPPSPPVSPPNCSSKHSAHSKVEGGFSLEKEEQSPVRPCPPTSQPKSLTILSANGTSLGCVFFREWGAGGGSWKSLGAGREMKSNLPSCWPCLTHACAACSKMWFPALLGQGSSTWEVVWGEPGDGSGWGCQRRA